MKANAPNEHIVIPNQHKTVAEFFAGIGLMRIGLEQAGWHVVFANDYDPQKRAMYKAQFPLDLSGLLLKDDIKCITSDQVPSVTLATASFPCNDLSEAGGRDGLDGAKSSAFWDFMRLIESMNERKPPLILIENVVGFLSSNGGTDLEKALISLNKMRYDVDAFILDASHFVPQSRRRLFVVGIPANETDRANRSVVRAQVTEVRPNKLVDFINCHTQIHWSLRDFPVLPIRRLLLNDFLEESLDVEGEWWSTQRRDYLLSQMSDSHQAKIAQMKDQEKWSYGTVFRRMRKKKSTAELRTDGIAGCLRVPRGGSAKQIILKVGYGQCFARWLTPREAARLMGVNDYNMANVSHNQALTGFGDAVCVPVVTWIANYYLNPLHDELREVGQT